ncbi:hypothetical protein LOTGIDRAFT_154775 [Lottia gigantea]|uniref:Uncharacterized protein n=1 Tax=Lottia gigantea TaxID=225164 RepID=V4A1U7_LOTGI|nr:hypothetical protein LOTGIDRAFT_154775 [Lottia gigantea]ESO87276.1 hypothetical protein LOTGIDRAFT_154775 [Lottia gigantea]
MGRVYYYITVAECWGRCQDQDKPTATFSGKLFKNLEVVTDQKQVSRKKARVINQSSLGELMMENQLQHITTQQKKTEQDKLNRQYILGSVQHNKTQHPMTGQIEIEEKYFQSFDYVWSTSDVKLLKQYFIVVLFQSSGVL